MCETTIDIPAIRKVLNLTQTQLAELAGVSISTVWRWENCGVPKRGPALAFLSRLNHGLGIANIQPTISPVLLQTGENGTYCGESDQCVPLNNQPEGS